ncbi:hypothetical protein EHO60_01425 [Leptospira fletcheri]|uniref:Uncharacterized protein n=1 Tax=Leptospira fletcheri TaxID=2484981 RepID=A0A4R9GKZ1_9LEPT|nr:hypothetical protein [Leptospira fletcheri]TGK14031.1 hypothetical protein EHO60_01425 [Leptospira fletcheri]
MSAPNWFNLRYFEQTTGESYRLRGLRKSLVMKEKNSQFSESLKISRSIKNVIFIWKLLVKVKVQKTETLRLRNRTKELVSETGLLKSEVRALKWELANAKSELALARNSLSFYKEIRSMAVESSPDQI